MCDCVVAKTVLAGSGSGRKGGKSVKVQAVSRARSSRKMANSDVGEESSSAGKFCIRDDFERGRERYLWVN